MQSITFSDQKCFELAKLVIDNLNDDSQANDNDRTIEILDDRVTRLIERLNTNEPAILLYPFQGNDYWLILGKNRRDIEQTKTRLTRFLSPSYGNFSEVVPKLHEFDPANSEIQALGNELFQHGYYRWISPPKYRNKIFDRMMLWLDLEKEQPEIIRTQTKTYHQLITQFDLAISDNDWELAEYCISELSHLHLCSSENLEFIRIQYLAAKKAWLDIWNNKYFNDWAQLLMPRSVRTILISAFYHCVLELPEREKKWAKACNEFMEYRERLGILLTGPFDEDNENVLRIIIYQAVIDNDISRLKEIGQDNPGPDLVELISNLRELCPTTTSESESESTYQSAFEAIDANDYMIAERMIENIQDIEEKTLILAELAYHTQDEQIKEKAWSTYQTLSFEQQERLRRHQRYVEKYLNDLNDYGLPLIIDSDPEAGTRTWPTSLYEMRIQTRSMIEDVERSLRRLIVEKFSNNYGENWIRHIHPNMAKNWDFLKSRDKGNYPQHDFEIIPLINYSKISDLNDIIGKNWNLFSDNFGQGKQKKIEFLDKFWVVIRVRNSLAHSRDLPTNELLRARVHSRDILLMLDCI